MIPGDRYGLRGTAGLKSLYGNSCFELRALGERAQVQLRDAATGFSEPALGSSSRIFGVADAHVKMAWKFTSLR